MADARNFVQQASTTTAVDVIDQRCVVAGGGIVSKH